MLNFLFAHWFDILQTISILFGFYVTIKSLAENTSTLRMKNLLELNNSYQSIWSNVISNPKLHRIFEQANLAQEPIKPEEEFVVLQNIVHLFTTYTAIKLGQLPKPKGMDENVREFFALPRVC